MDRTYPPFRFKQFEIRHERCTMKVGTDAVLLGAWVTVSGAKRLLDVGTGSGVLALMLAQRTSKEVKIDAVEISHDDFVQAEENAANSDWQEKITNHHTSIQEYVSEIRYDLIVSNPPYFMKSLLPASNRRKQARHTLSLSYDELVIAAKRLLSPTGIFSVILPTSEGDRFLSLASASGLHCSRRLAFYSRKQKTQERWLMEFSFKPVSMVTESLVLYDRGMEWSDEYKNLTRDFYL